MNQFVLLTTLCLLVGSSVSKPATEEETNVNDLQVEGRGIRDMAKNVWDFFFGEGDDYDYNDYYDFNPNDVSSYTWYDPSSARQDTFDLAEEEDEYSWGEMFAGASLALFPIGLLLAGLPAGLFTVAIKKRSFGDDNILDKIDPTQLPLLQSLREGDLLALARPQCQKKLFCELSQLGKSESSSLLQRGFYFVSQVVPDNMAKRFRLQRLFVSTRENQCHKFTCHTATTKPHLSPSNHLEVPTKDMDF